MTDTAEVSRRLADHKAGVLVVRSYLCARPPPRLPMSLAGERGLFAFNKPSEFTPERLFCSLAGLAAEAYGSTLDAAETGRTRGDGFADLEEVRATLDAQVVALAEGAGKPTVERILEHWPDADWRRGIKGAVSNVAVFWRKIAAVSELLQAQGKIDQAGLDRVRAGAA